MEVFRSSLLGHPERVLGHVLVPIIGVGMPCDLEGIVTLTERVPDVSEENQPEGDVPVIAGVHGTPTLVDGGTELLLEARVGSVARLAFLLFRLVGDGP